ncbi:MAG TPA: MFS transporter, partial [Phycisphaerae bacterium]|nr:MFS transporter [Phycisphaerae bacterium]
MTILFTPAGYLWLDMMMLGVVGFFIYPVLNLILIMSLDLTSKKAVGTAAGFIGLFGYLGRMTQAQGFGLMQKHLTGLYGRHATWDMVLYSIVGCAAVAVVLLAFTWRVRPKA